MKKFFLRVYNNNQYQFARFIIAGVLNTLFGAVIGFLFLYFLPFHYSLSVFLATLIGIIFNYYNNSKFVFKNELSLFKISLFFLTYGILYLFNIIFMALIMSYFLMESYEAFLFVIPIMALITYYIQKKFIFS